MYQEEKKYLKEKTMSIFFLTVTKVSVHESYKKVKTKSFLPQENGEKSIQSIYNENNTERRENAREDQQQSSSDRASRLYYNIAIHYNHHFSPLSHNLSQVQTTLTAALLSSFSRGSEQGEPTQGHLV